MAAAKGNKYNQKWTKELIQELADELIEWAAEPDSTHFSQFCGLRHKKSKSWLEELADRHPVLFKAKVIATELLAGKYLDRSVKNEWNVNMCEKYLPVYDKEYKDILKWKASLSSQKEQDERDKVKGSLTQVTNVEISDD